MRFQMNGMGMGMGMGMDGRREEMIIRLPLVSVIFY